jgi:hypothetical protein
MHNNAFDPSLIALGKANVGSKGDMNMLNPPGHLTGITQIDKTRATDQMFVAQVVCTCGCRDLNLMHSGGTREENGHAIPQTAEIDGKFFMMIRADCPECQKTHLVFDKDYHGWDGFVCARETGYRQNPRPDLVPWQCVKCQSTSHLITVLVSMDKEIILEDGPVTGPDDATILDDSNWPEGFDWITMEIICSSCGHKTEEWLSYETM